MSKDSTEKPLEPSARPFLPAKPAGWLVSVAQTIARVDLSVRNRVHIDAEDLKRIADLPKGAGVILTPNHADEMDPRVCVNLSRLTGRRFIFMCNREAFDEWGGLAGWGMQRLGLYSVERGGHDLPAKRFSVDVVARGKDVLVIFPEGEIFYLNDSVQPFHSGAIDIGMQAILEKRQTESAWTSYVVPLAIKYRYQKPIDDILKERVKQLESKLSRDRQGLEIRKRLKLLLSDMVQKAESAHHIQCEYQRLTDLGERVTTARHAILANIENRYKGIAAEQGRTIDRAWELSAHIREVMAQGVTMDSKARLENDLSDLKQVAHMVSWQPQYFDGDGSPDRLAEVVLKLEREILKVKRPGQLAKRDVFLRVGQPINLADFIAEYEQDQHAVRHKLAQHMRETIQSLINEIDVATSVQPETVGHRRSKD
jgi:1-acyl-sn-glycerol-3-phosphate acyltransferase